MLALIARRFGVIVLPFGMVGAFNGTGPGYVMLILSTVAIGYGFNTEGN